MKDIIITFCLFVFYFHLQAQSVQTITLSTGSNWTDATVRMATSSSYPNQENTNYNNYPILSASAWTAGGGNTFWRNLLKFDLSVIPGGATIQSATLYFYSDPTVTSSSAWNGNSQLSGSNAFYLEKNTASWNPTTVTWNSQPNTTTTNRVWVGPSTSTTENIKIDITNMVQDWVYDPSANHGVKMILENELHYRSRNYASTDHSNTSIHPKLVIDYTTVATGVDVEDSSAYVSVDAYRQDVFRMDLQQVPGGILLEYSLFPFEASKQDGLLSDDDTLKDKGRIFGLLDLLKTSNVNSTVTVPSADLLFAEAYLHRHNTGNIPLTFVYQPYHRIRESALNENLLQIASDDIGIEDVPGRTTSPYDLHQLFAFGLFADTVSQFNSITFSLPNVLWQMQGVSSVEVDFDDGNGFNTLSSGSTSNVYYASEGVKTLTARITAGGATRTAKAQFYYRRPETFVQPDYTVTITANPVYTNDSEYMGGGAAFRMMSSHCEEGSFWQRIRCQLQLGARVEVENGCDDVFDRPVIIVEGFDPDGTLKIQELRRRFGAQDFRTTLMAAGHDLVYVDFTKNQDYIENNAKVLENVLNWVNQNKTGTFQSSVIGYSMGGLISRWCLKDMEDRGLNHQVENYFSYDAPHQGANIPLSMQYIFNEIERDMGYLRFFSEGFREISDANKSPAARQMMVNRPAYDLDARALRREFAERLVNKGYPQQTNNYGIAFGRGDNIIGTSVAGNGEESGGFGPGDQIFEGNLAYYLVNFQSEGYALPANGSRQLLTKYNFQGLATKKIFGLPVLVVPEIRFKKVYYTGYHPYDDAPGGFGDTQAQFAESLDRNGAAGDPNTFGHDRHNFLSTVSALDLQNQGYSASNDWKSNDLYFPIDNFIQNTGAVGGNTLTDPTLSPFQAVVTSSSDQAGDNLDHNADIAAPFSDFIVQYILNLNPVGDCEGTAFCDAEPIITGPDVICNNATYTIIDVPNNVTIAWSSQNNKVSVTNGQGTPTATFTVNSSGPETIVATITSVCGADMTITHQIQAGEPITPGTISIQMNAPPYRFTASIVAVDGATSYNWYLDDVMHSSHTTGAVFNRDAPYCGGYYVVKVEAVNACGTSLKSHKDAFEPSCSYYSLTLTPNPSLDASTVSITNENEIIKPDADWDLVVYDRDQQVLHQERGLSRAGFELDTKNWQTGIYLIKVFYKGEGLNAKLVVAE